MANIKIFKNESFGSIRVAGTSEQPLFCLTDLCQSIGIANPRNAKTRLDEEDVRVVDTLTNGGKQKLTYISESGMYEIILRSDSDKAKPFRKWVTSEVLPSIRKQGGYMVAKADETEEEVLARALIIANSAIKRRDERIKVLESENKQKTQLLLAQGDQITEMQTEIGNMLPKVNYLDRILQSKSTVCTTQIAADYGMSAKKFNILLRNYKIQRKVGGQWVLYSPYNTMGYVHSETFIPETSTTGKVVMTSKWTQKGRIFLYEFLKKREVLPLIEQ